MVIIKKITIENFRGIRLPLEIEFIKGGNPTSALIYGNNGTGKSSIVDAWEWLLKFEIEKLKKEGISTKDYPHKLCNGDNSYINVEFTQPPIISTKISFDKLKISSPTVSGQYKEFKSKNIYPNYLRYSDLQDFVYMTKTKKYEYIAKFFGLEEFIKNQSDIQTSLTRFGEIYKNLKATLDNNILKIKKIVGDKEISEALMLEFINAIAKKYNMSTISILNEVEGLKNNFQETVKKNPIAAELIQWKSFQSRLNQFYPLPINILIDCKAVEADFTDLKKEEKNITELVLSELYKLSIEVIPSLEDITKCPLCDTVFEGDLLKHIEKKHTALETLNKKKIEFDKKIVALIKKLRKTLSNSTVLLSESNPIIRTGLKELFEDVEFVTVNIPQIIEDIEKEIKDISSLSISDLPSIIKVESLSSQENEIKKLVSEKIKILENDPANKDLAQDHEKLFSLIAEYKDYLKNSKKADTLSSIGKKIRTLFEELTAYIQKQIQDTFSQIQGDVVEFYNFLEQSNPFLKNPVIRLVTGKDKAVELEIEFVSEKITPAYKFMSESQVNSFGLSIFLAAVKYFNKEFKFMILDDVINSFDAYKRPKVSQLLAAKFTDFQILMLTHDQIFFDNMQRGFPQWNRYKFTNWDYTTGPKFKVAKNYIEEVQEYLDEDKPITAGQSLGRYLEWTLGVLNQNLKTPIPYKVENIYTLTDYYDPLIKRFKDKLKLAGKTHKLIQLIDGNETSFRNYCVHWKNETTPITTPEMIGIYQNWIQIEKMVYCDSCKSFISLDNSTSTEYVRCACTSLDLKKPEYYN